MSLKYSLNVFSVHKQPWRGMRRLQNPVERLTWSFLRKYLTALSRWLISRKARSWMFHWVLDTPLDDFWKIGCRELSVNYRLFVFIFIKKELPPLHFLGKLTLVNKALIFQLHFQVPAFLSPSLYNHRRL